MPVLNWLWRLNLRPKLLGRPRSQFEEKDKIEQDRGFCLHRLSTHTIGGEARYTALWRTCDERELPFIDLTENSYRREYASRLEFGFRVKLLSITVVNGEPRYSGCWAKHVGNYPLTVRG